MAEIVKLGEVTCPSGQLVLMDGGYLGLWTDERSPEDARRPDEVPAVDYEVGDLTECDGLALPGGTIIGKAPPVGTSDLRQIRARERGLYEATRELRISAQAMFPLQLSSPDARCPHRRDRPCRPHGR
jgi:hypothetical protein